MIIDNYSMKKGTVKVIVLIAALAFVALALSFVAGVFASDVCDAAGNEAKINDTEYATLEDALDSAVSGDTITMLTDAVISDGAAVTVSPITIDLNSNTVTLPAGKTFSVMAITLTNGNFVNNGTIVSSVEIRSSAVIGGNGGINGNGTMACMYMTGGSIIGQTVTAGADTTIAVIAIPTGHSAVTVKSCTLISTSNNAINGIYGLTNENCITISDIEFQGKSSSYAAITLEVHSDTNIASIADIEYSDATWGLDVEMDLAALTIGEGGIEFDYSIDSLLWYYGSTVPTVTFTEDITVTNDIYLYGGNYIFSKNVTINDGKKLKVNDTLTNNGTITNKGEIEASAPILNFGTISGGKILDKYQDDTTIRSYNGATVSNVTVDMYKTGQRISMSTDGGATISNVTFNGLDEVVLEADAKPVGLYVNPCSTAQTTVENITVNANNKMGYAVEVAPVTASDKAVLKNITVTGSLKAQPMDICASANNIVLGADYISISNVCDIVLWSSGGPYTYTLNDLYIKGCLRIYNGTADLPADSDVTVGSLIVETEGALSVNDTAKFLINTTLEISADSAEKTYDKLPLTAGYTCPVAYGAMTADVTMASKSTITDVGRVFNVIESYKILVGTTDITKYFVDTDIKSGTLTVNRAVLTATYESENVKCGAIPAYKVILTGFVAGEDVSAVTMVPTVYNPSSVVKGIYVLEPANGSARNYSFSYVSGVLTVEHDLKAVEKSGNIIAHYACDGCGNHYIDNAATIKYTLPENGSEGQEVSVDADVTGGTATVDSSKITQTDDAVKSIKAADPSAIVIADISAKDSSVKKISIESSDMVKLSGSASGVKLSTSSVAATFSSNTVKGIATAGKFNLNASLTNSYPSKYKDLVGVNGIVMDLSLDVNGTAVTQFGEKVVLSFYYEIPVGHSASELRIWCISSDSPEEFKCSYDENTKMVTAETTHFSQYAVTLDSSSNSGNSTQVGFYVIIGVVVALTVVLALLGFRKH